MSTGPTTPPENGESDRRGRTRRLPRLRDARIRSKLALILVVPVAAVIALASIRLVSTGQGAVEATMLRSLTSLSADVSALTQDLHKERMAAARYLARPGGKPDAFNLRVRSTDAQIEAYNTARGQIDDIPDAVDNRLKVIDDHLRTLNSTRNEVLDRQQKMAVAEAALRYGVILTDLVSYGDTLAQLPGQESLADKRRAVAAFAHAKAAVAEEESVAFTALSAGRLDEEQFSAFLATLTRQQEALVSFSLAADPIQRALVDTTVSGDAVVLADRVAGDVTRSVGRASLVTAADASSSIGSVNDLMRWAEIRLQDRLLAETEDARSAVIQQAIIEAALVLLTLTIAITLAVVLARSLNHSLRRLREGALSVANHDLPDAVSRLQNIGNVGDGGVEEIVRQVRDPIKLSNRDEVGQVAAAFNVVHREAVRVAAEQAALRTSVSAMFLNLARRSQTLVDRMIGELDAIERGEEDPKRLAKLFELDHLATRMRRNDENLLVLAGADSGVPRREDALLIDVLRASQSEVEQYNRIEFGTVDTDISVAAQAVNDVVRLVAELLDNATRFSPPNTVVVADGRRIRDYVLIQVEDRGLGLTDEQLDSLNRRLSAPSTVDVAAFRLMGLAVVSRLAARHSIRVELRRNVEGGTVAQVTLPNSAVVLPSLQGREPALGSSRHPAPIESPLSPMGYDQLTSAGQTSTATLTDQWHTPTSAPPAPAPTPARWQALGEARDSTPSVQFGGPALTPAPMLPPNPPAPALSPNPPAPAPQPAAPALPTYSAGGLSVGSPTVAYPTLDPLPKRVPGADPVPPVGSTAPAAPVLAAGPVAGAAPNVPAVPVAPRPAPPGEAPIFREMEAVWFRSHGNDATAIFQRPSFDEPPAPAAPQATAAVQPQAAAPRPTLPTRTPGSTPNVSPPAAAPPPAYSPPVAPPAAEPAPAIDPEAWRTAADEGWSLASRAAEPDAAGTTRSGLPKRVPQAQLVPGGIESKDSSRERTRRSPDEVRGLLSAYHRGVQRGRSVGGDPTSTSTKETNR